MSINNKIDKYDMVFLYNRIPYDTEKEQLLLYTATWIKFTNIILS